MPSTQMEEQKDCDAIGSQLQSGSKNHVSSFYLVKLLRSPEEIEKEEADKQYQLLTLTRSRINEDVDQRKADEHQINRKLMWFSQHDKYIQWKMQEIKNLERCLGKDEIHLPTNSVLRRTGFLHLPGKDAPAPVIIPDRKRSQERLIKKGRLDTQYLQQIQEELLSSKKSGGMTSSGTQEVNDLIESMAQRVQHASKSRADEMRIYHEMRKAKETKEIYTAPEPNPRSHWYSRERKSKRDIDSERRVQHTINIRLDDIEDMKIDLKGRKARVTRLKAELELLRKSISCLQKELEDVNTKRIKAYKGAYKLGEQKKELNCM